MEKLIRNALYRIVIWRIIGDVFSSLRTVIVGIQNFVAGIERAIWLIETEAARSYLSSTGLDAGAMILEPGRYRGLRLQLDDEDYAGTLDRDNEGD